MISLGSRVWVTEKLRRSTQRRYWKTGPCYMKEWVAERLPEDTTGILVGYRTYSNGKAYFDSEGLTHYEPVEYFQVALIVKDLRSAPFPALPENVHPHEIDEVNHEIP